MKKQFVAVAAAFLITFSSAFASGNNPVPEAVVKEFHKAFESVNDVQWKTTKNFYKASFKVDGQLLDAFYAFDGKMIGLSRFITVDQLPMSLAKEVVKKSETAAVSDLFEMLTDKGTEYFITYKNEKASTTYKSEGGYWVRY